MNIVGAVQIACTLLPDGAECQAYSAPAPTVEGGVEGVTAPPFTWELDGSLPPGLTLADDGTITGTPTTTGTFDFAVSVTDADGLTAAVDQTITIAPGCPTPTPTPTPTAVGRPYGRRGDPCRQPVRPTSCSRRWSLACCCWPPVRC